MVDGESWMVVGGWQVSCVLVALLFVAAGVQAGPPGLINCQGRMLAGTNPVNGRPAISYYDGGNFVGLFVGPFVESGGGRADRHEIEKGTDEGPDEGTDEVGRRIDIRCDTQTRP